MAKYLVETYYTCTFKVNHYLDDINETELKNLEKRDDGKFEVLDVKLDNRKTKSSNLILFFPTRVFLYNTIFLFIWIIC